MVRISIAAEEDLPQVLEIEQEAISPPWTYGALQNELHREDSFFAAARRKSQITNHIPSLLAMTKDGGSTDLGVQNPDLPAVDESVCGFVIIRRMGDEGELLQIAVDKAARRHGVADVLMESALFYASMNFLKSVFLEVRVSNFAAIELYKKHGFVSVRTRKDYYDDPAEDAMIMEREVIRKNENFI